jgi:hypothetical protein
VLGLGLFVQGFTTKENKIISYFFRLLIINHRIYLKIGTLKLHLSTLAILIPTLFLLLICLQFDAAMQPIPTLQRGINLIPGYFWETFL